MKIRVLHILETIGYGGVERRRLSLCKLLNKEQFELKIICSKTLGDISKEMEQYGVEVIPIGITKSPFAWKQHKKVQRIIEEYKPHIIHGAVFEGVTLAAVNGFLKRVPIVLIEETSNPENRGTKANLLMKLFGKFATRAIGVSPAAYQYLRETLRLSEKKTVLINNGVAIPKSEDIAVTQNLRSSLGITEDTVVIGSVGRMNEDVLKCYSHLITAFSNLYKEHPNTVLVLVGDGEERVNYETLVKSLGIADKVFFAGYQDNPSPYYYVFDIFSLVSSREAFGLVIAEAMLHKLPVMATRVGGIPYVVEENETAYLVDAGAIDEMTDKLQILIENPSLRIRMGEAGYQRAMEYFTEERYVENIKNLYESLLNEKGIV